ncbi:hypothetical protein GTQ34_13055 [Muricauda sp. JGD-17]|uniref:Copper chaperone NosL n=1 Tax=Flagellimonas ochracea TaxID=2696472 RepID=A0A964WY71_9FLAO|nr:hypothetical protein [Allomuricauda ochracea]NAY92845.1 hypothetical protein [Allomuricauda ochracea]
MKKSRIIMALAALLPLLLFVFPLWKITLEAPQYPTPLGMYIHINDFADANPHDIKNINLMNHYVGMKYIPDAIPEFKIFPIGIVITTIIGLIIAFKANHKWFLYWFIMMVLVSTAGLIDFYLWEHEYGHDLDPRAIMKFTNPDGSVMGFQPPFFGTKNILNFTAHSYPRLGAYFLGLGIALGLVAYYLGRKQTLKA